MENNKLFCFGILKRGYNLSLDNYGAKFIGEATIQGAVLYGIGCAKFYSEGLHTYKGVGLKVDKDPSMVAYGELWEVPGSLWRWLDDIEQNGRVYERKITDVTVAFLPDEDDYVTDAWVYEHMYEGFTEDQRIEGGKF